MKKICILLPMILLLFGCVESELIIQGENVGGGNGGGEEPDPTFKLKTFDYETPFYSYQYNYNAEGLLTQGNVSLEILGEVLTGGFTLGYTDNLISQINMLPEGLYSNQSNLTFNDQNQLTEINAATTPETKFMITHDGASITAVRTIDGLEENTFTFTKDSYGYINSYSFTDNISGDNIQVMFTMDNNLITSNKIMVNGTAVETFTYTYDNKVNPLYIQTIDYFNVLMMNDAFEFDVEDATLSLDSYPMYRSANNIQSMTITTDSRNATLTYEYQYNANDLPTSAMITVEGEEPGAATYTYY